MKWPRHRTRSRNDRSARRPSTSRPASRGSSSSRALIDDLDREVADASRLVSFWKWARGPGRGTRRARHHRASTRGRRAGPPRAADRDDGGGRDRPGPAAATPAGRDRAGDGPGVVETPPGQERVEDQATADDSPPRWASASGRARGRGPSGHRGSTLSSRPGPATRSGAGVGRLGPRAIAADQRPAQASRVESLRTTPSWGNSCQGMPRAGAQRATRRSRAKVTPVAGLLVTPEGLDPEGEIEVVEDLRHPTHPGGQPGPPNAAPRDRSTSASAWLMNDEVRRVGSHRPP